jgi:hypothetical protein
MLLGLAVGLVAAPIARADESRPEAPATEQSGGSGPERMGGQPMTGAPHAPTAVGQSPLPLQSDDQRDVQKPDTAQQPQQDHSDLNGQTPTGK